ncbi:hypothetical protein SNE40_018097 [Patella caerulea]
MIAETESVRDVTTRDPLRHREFDGLSREDERFVAVATNSITLFDNHYTVDLPFRHNPSFLGDNVRIAEQSLRRLRKKLDPYLRYLKITIRL